MEELESHLRNLCATDARLRLLEAQWEYDKHLVRQALQTVGTTFPHYSLHDASHSNTILVNVVRVLGARLGLLSATDTWLLLESAYWHDIGMVVSDSAIRTAWCSPEFKTYLAELLNSNDAMLASAARLVSDRELISQLNEDWPLDVRQALTFVAADFFRRRHPGLSAEAVRHPTGHSISSPRTLIPARLFELLAQICLAHGQSREAVGQLPFQENGIGRDLCHPRLVAFLLRLGDLLDLDNNRFCPVLLASIGRLPPTSRDHIGKHASIERFYVGPDRVDVLATCRPSNESSSVLNAEAYRSYQAIKEWFRWLRDELTHLAINWARIAPPTMGAPPSIGEIRARLEGYELLPTRDSPDFDVDRDYFLHLSKSAGIFGSPHEAWQRELITNAVDATLLRVWLTATDDARAEILASADPLRQIYTAAKRFPIRVAITPSNELAGSPGVRNWLISISDEGCGIGSEDLSSLQVIGSSSRNRERCKLIEQVPEILQPTGSFGLGFQSVFLDTDEALITTEHLATGVKRQILAARPSKRRQRGVDDSDTRAGLYVKSLGQGDSVRRSPGTTIRFSVERPSTYGIDRTDPVVTEAQSPTIDVWFEELSKICASLPVPVAVNGKLIESAASDEAFAYFDHSNAVRIAFALRGIGQDEAKIQSYRGASVQSTMARGELLPYSADLYCGKASEMLQVSRTAFTEFGSVECRRRVDAALPAAVDAYVEHLRSVHASDKTALGRASLLAHAKFKSGVAGAEWEGLRIIRRVDEAGAEVPISIGEFLAQEEVTFAVAGRGIGMRRRLPPAKLDVGTCLLSMMGREEVAGLVRERFAEVCHVDVVGAAGDGSFISGLDIYVARKRKTGAAVVTKEAFEKLVLPVFPGRAWLPCLAGFENLELRRTSGSGFANVPMMLSPFVVTSHPFDECAVVAAPNLRDYLTYVSSHGGSGHEVRQSSLATQIEGLIVMIDAVFAREVYIRREYDLQLLCKDLRAAGAQS